MDAKEGEEEAAACPAATASTIPPRKLDCREEEEEAEESFAGIILDVSLHSAPLTGRKKPKLPELWRTFSIVSWCPKYNLIACATEVCARDPRFDSSPVFWIPVHIVNPERPTEHAVFNVAADSPCDSIQSLEWSPMSCPRALLVANSCGRVSIWTQPGQAFSNVARAVNCWYCEHEWRQDQAVATKWLCGAPPYRWVPTSSSSKASFEEKFLSNQACVTARWPNFLCACSIFTSGSVQLHWCQWPPAQPGCPPKWFSTSKGNLGAGPSGIFAGDALVNEAGTLLVAGVPVGNPSTVVVWEVVPGRVNTSQMAPVRAGGSVQSSPPFTSSNWPGFAPLAAYLLCWQENLGLLGTDMKPGTVSKESKVNTSLLTHGQDQPHSDADDRDPPLLQCSPVSNLSAYVMPEGTSQSAPTGWVSGVAAVAFDPSQGGSMLAVLAAEGNLLLIDTLDEGPLVIGYKVQRWESSRQQVGIHPLFEAGMPSYTGSSQQMATTWKSTAEKSLPFSKHGVVSGGNQSNYAVSSDEHMKFMDLDRPTNIRPRPKIVFSPHGGEVTFTVFGGEVHTFSGLDLVPLDSFYIRAAVHVTPAFSPTGCCLSTAWHDSKRECSILRILRVHPPPVTTAQMGINVSWEHTLAERFWWSLVSEVDWWDAVGCTQSAVEDGLVTTQKVIAILDNDFHAFPTIALRQHYGPALDSIKCRMLEGVDGSDVRAVVLDMQARLLLETLGKGIEAALINPSTFISEPWQASGETLNQLVPDAMAVDPAVLPYMQSYVDAVLDLASHFLTRLRRYASFCRTLATHAASITSNVGNTKLSTTSCSSTGTAATPPPGTQVSAGSSNGTTSVQAWVQGAIAKVTNTSEGAISSVSVAPGAVTGTVPPLQLSVSQAAFPAMPAVRLIGDCHFLHKLCQLLLFCFIFQRRQFPRFTSTPPRNLDGNAVVGKPISVPGGKGPDEVITSGSTNRSTSTGFALKSEDGQSERSSVHVPGVKMLDEAVGSRSGRLGSGNAGYGYTAEEVKFLFLASVDLCKRTSSLPHPMPKSQAGAPSPSIRLHYTDGQYTVAPEVVEASLGNYIQSLPRPRGADSAGLLMRELELHPPAEDWNKRNGFGGPWAGYTAALWSFVSDASDDLSDLKELWPKKRRKAERDTAFGQTNGVGMGRFFGFMGSQRDVITASWKNTPHGVWHKCMRCGRQTGALATHTMVNQSPSDSWCTGRWAYACPMCGGRWIQIV